MTARNGLAPAMLGAFLLLPACSTRVFVDNTTAMIQNTRDRVGESGDFNTVAAQNQCLLDLLYRDELAVKAKREHRPVAGVTHLDRGIALSGGGMRAASFSMGILKALHENGDLERADIVSSVSGGGYTLTWYLLQKANGAKADEMFGTHTPTSETAYQKLIGERGALASTSRGVAYAALDIFPFSLWNLFANGLFGWHVNTSPGRLMYDKRLRRIFDTNPGDKKLINADWLKLRSDVENGTIPPFVINTSVFVDDDPSHLSGKMSNITYEFTPWHYGGAAFGYTPQPPPIDLPRAASISGGALDLISIAAGFSQKMLISALNLDIGYSMPNPRFTRPLSDSPDRVYTTLECGRRVPVLGTTGPARKGETARQWMTPLPIYLAKPWYARHVGGARVYLSDGGFSENLGAFALVRRLTEQIVVVDAEYDPKFEFGAYARLKEAIRAELNAKLEIATIDKIQSGNADFNPSRPVMVGKISSFPIAPDEKPLTIRVVYVKLAMDKHQLENYSDVTSKYYLAQGIRKGFPQESTVDQNYDTARFVAYRELGATIGRCIPQFDQFPATDPECEFKQK